MSFPLRLRVTKVSGGPPGGPPPRSRRACATGRTARSRPPSRPASSTVRRRGPGRRYWPGSRGRPPPSPPAAGSSSATPGNPFSTRDTVMTETPGPLGDVRHDGPATPGRPSCPLVLEPVERRFPADGVHPDHAAEEPPGHLRREVASVDLAQRVGGAERVLEPERDGVGTMGVRARREGQDDGAPGRGGTRRWPRPSPTRERAMTGPPGRRPRSAPSRPADTLIPASDAGTALDRARTRQRWCCWRRLTKVGSGESSVASPPARTSQPGRVARS